MASTLVGKFLGARPNIDVVRAYAKKKWDLKGQVAITTMATGFLSFEFSCQEDLTRILCAGSWAFGKSTLALQRWTSKLNLNDSFSVQTPVWVRLPELPIEYWYEDFFDGIANFFGELLSIDPITMSRQ